MTIPNYIESELGEVARKLLLNFSQSKVWCFYAEMGSGKTTLIKKIGRELGVLDEMSSPTFSLVNEYETKYSELIYHFDLYRLNNLEEALEIGIDEYLFSGNFCLIEWPELIESLLPSHYLKININLVGDIARSLTATPE